MDQDKQILRPIFKQSYKHELLNNLFFHPYTKIEYIEKDMMVQRKTATKYLDMIVETGILKKMKIGRENYYINTALAELFMNVNNEPAVKVDTIGVSSAIATCTRKVVFGYMSENVYPKSRFRVHIVGTCTRKAVFGYIS